MVATKEGLPSELEQALAGQEASTAAIVTDRGSGGKGPSGCMRCGRKLTNPHSIARNLGPVCYKKSGGGAFESQLEVPEEQWELRAEAMRRGGEADFGYWDCVVQTEHGPVVLIRAMRVSVRFRDGAFEAYGTRFLPGGGKEDVVFYRGGDVRECWRAAIAAGPESAAAAYRTQREIARAWKAQARRR